jgi:type IV secretory pathway TrbD component
VLAGVASAVASGFLVALAAGFEVDFVVGLGVGVVVWVVSHAAKRASALMKVSSLAI